MMRRFGCCKSNSGDIARRRLKMLLVSDKIHVSPGYLDLIKDDLVGVLSRYMEVDSGQLDLRLTRMETAGTKEWIPALSASIPIGQLSDKGMK